MNSLFNTMNNRKNRKYFLPKAIKKYKVKKNKDFDYFEIEVMSSDLFKNLTKDHKRKLKEDSDYKLINNIDNQIEQYDLKYFEMFNTDKCLIEQGSDVCYCSKCIIKQDLYFEMLNKNEEKLMDLKGNLIYPICSEKFYPIIEKRGKHYFILIKSDIKGFNIFYPINCILKSFY